METIILALSLRLEPERGDHLLTEMDCDLHPVIYQFLRDDPTINDLLELANIGLSNIIGPNRLSDIHEALVCINEEFSFCNSSTPAQQALVEADLPEFDQAVEELPDLNLYPNPTAGTVIIQSQRDIDSIEVYSLLGKAVATFRDTKEADISHLGAGIYYVKITSQGASITKKIVKS